MTLDDFIQATRDSDAAAPQELPELLLALWHAKRAEWDKAHEIVQSLETHDAAWVHAHLHRVEGDLPNARYWYSRADRAEPSYDTATEWRAITSSLLETYK